MVSPAPIYFVFSLVAKLFFTIDVQNILVINVDFIVVISFTNTNNIVTYHAPKIKILYPSSTREGG